MINSIELEDRLKRNHVHNCYVFCGKDEHTIKRYIAKIFDNFINKKFVELNYIQLDGTSVNIDKIINACETLPFMDDKKLVVVYRANFLKDKVDSYSDKLFKQVVNYIKDLPKHCIFIMYYIFESDREKESKKVKSLDKVACVVKLSKLWGNLLQKKVGEILKEKGKKIDRANLSLLCSVVENNIDIIENEIEKLCCYTIGREITSKDIFDVITTKNDNDIFNLVDFLAQRNPEKSIDILNELLFKGESINGILRMIERQFKMIFNIKLGIKQRKSIEQLSKELKIPPFICEKIAIQSKKFNIDQIEKIIKLCLESEKKLKSTSIDAKTEMELLIINIVIV